MKKCGCSPAEIHRMGALGILRNPIKHGSARKVAVTTQEGHLSARETQDCRLFTRLRYMFFALRASNWVATQEEIYL